MPDLDATMTEHATGVVSLLSGAVPAAVRLVYGENADLGRVEPLDAENRTVGTAKVGGLMARIPCFTPGSLIATERGECPAEDVRPGDRVVTRDNGPQQVLWTGRTTFGWRELGLLPVLRPVLIRKGALGDGLPSRNLFLSPNHRLLVRSRSDATEGGSEALVAARDLAGRPGIEVMAPAAVTYLQLLFARHEAVLADGVWTESFQAGAPVLEALPDTERDAILAVRPELADPAGAALAPVRPEVGGDDIVRLHC